MPSSFLFRINNGQMQYGNSNFIFPPSLSPVTISSVANFPSGADVTGTSVTNGITYNVYAFRTTGVSYTVNYSCKSATQIYVLAVGGGGAGGYYAASGGGAGGVVMMPVSLPSTGGANATITISVGAGGLNVSNANGLNGDPTTVTFSGTVNPTVLTAGGGGGGSKNGGTIVTGFGGSGGGGNNTPLINSYNYANGGGYNGSYVGENGGGGAGTAGTDRTLAKGGNGIQCFLPGINNFTPSGTSYGSYYWGGGGGGGYIVYGDGGIGGGGGGGSIGGGAKTQGIGGGLAINPGSNGGNEPINGIAYGGNGGTNTGGGGGGGGDGSGYGGNGGSGIVVIAFPSSATITSNIAAVLPASVYSSSLYNAVLNNASLSQAAYSSIKGAFGCRLLNYNYFGPTFTLRHSLDTTGAYTKNFYSDICGNLGTGYLGTGQSISAWLTANGANTTYAFVSKWYNQGMDASFNCATQSTLASQPVYEVANGVINFNYIGATTIGTAPTTNYFNLPTNTFPSTSPTTAIVRRGGMSTNSPFYFVGLANATYFSMYYIGGGGITTYSVNGSASTSHSTAATASGDVITVNENRTGGTGFGSFTTYINGTSAATTNHTSYPNIQGTGYANYIGLNTFGTQYTTGQMYNFYLFTSSLTPGASSDQSIVEATPYKYSALPSMTLSTSSITSTTFVPTWTAVSNATTYVMYVNSSAYGPVTSGQTVTPVSSGPWNVNVYAYNATNNLLASGFASIMNYSVISASNILLYYPLNNLTGTTLVGGATFVPNYATGVPVYDASLVAGATSSTYTTLPYIATTQAAGSNGSMLFVTESANSVYRQMISVTTPSPFTLSAATGLTICMWVKFNYLTSYMRLLHFGPGGANFNNSSIIMCLASASNTIQMYCSNSSGTTPTTITSTKTIATGIWYFMCLTVDSAGNHIMNVYSQNGGLTSTSGGSAIAYVTSFPYAYIGARASWVSGDPAFDGYMTEFRMYNRVITDSEMQKLYSQVF